jgi:hypothetical protein
MEVVQLASTNVFTDEDGSLVWQFTKMDLLFPYIVINHRGVLPVFVSAMCGV